MSSKGSADGPDAKGESAESKGTEATFSVNEGGKLTYEWKGPTRTVTFQDPKSTAEFQQN